VLEAPNRDRQAERREATRQEILSAAWAVAREQGLAQLTLREVAGRVGMRAPSLYTHFSSKHAIYDAMFADAWTQYLEIEEAAGAIESGGARSGLRQSARAFFEFAVADLARHQLMNQRTIPGFEPSPEAYAPAVAVLDRFRSKLAGFGVTREEDVDLCTAIVGGLVDAQLANDPGGDRWGRLLDRAVDMLADNLGLPPDNSEEAS
jgi:AcrR family transcriptional regulator